MKNHKQIGDRYEALAAQELACRGYVIIQRNFRCKFGEIDIIAKKDDCLIFVEVKYRGTTSFGVPSEAVDARKQRRISNTASYYLYTHSYALDTPCRFDVVAVLNDKIAVIENAFSYCGNFYF